MFKGRDRVYLKGSISFVICETRIKVVSKRYIINNFKDFLDKKMSNQNNLLDDGSDQDDHEIDDDDYLPADEIIHAINERPFTQSVVVTGRGGGSALQAAMDTVSEVREVKHAFKAGIMARKGVDY